MKYDKEATAQLLELWNLNPDVETIAELLGVPKRSVIAKLSALGLYSRKPYLNKRGEIPVKKEEYLEKLSELLGEPLEKLESLEKCNKNVLVILVNALQTKSPQAE